jgi:hypothetical protein
MQGGNPVNSWQSIPSEVRLLLLVFFNVVWIVLMAREMNNPVVSLSFIIGTAFGFAYCAILTERRR